MKSKPLKPFLDNSYIEPLLGKGVHMVGIGGIGMSGLAFLLLDMGFRVSGSDITESNLTQLLRGRGARVYIGHKSSNIKKCGILVYSTSINRDNPEILYARKKSIPVVPRMELLKYMLNRHNRSIIITGTHGKTTITAMAALLLDKTGFSPTVLIGGEHSYFNGNARLGNGNFIVSELDESDGKFSFLCADYIIIPNLEKEHMEFYKSEDHLVMYFQRFLKNQKNDTVLIYNKMDPRLKKLALAYMGKKLDFGFSSECMLRAYKIKLDTEGSTFRIIYKGYDYGKFRLNIPGMHNVTNVLSVILLGIEMGLDFDTINRTLLDYKGVKRRFERKAFINGVCIIEDYAHHPTELKATIKTAQGLGFERIISVFQPHRYTRTKHFSDEFSKSFTGCHEVILTDVYSASEKKLRGVSTENIYDMMARCKSPATRYLEKSAISLYLSLMLRRGDLVLILGAGDIGEIIPEIINNLKRMSNHNLLESGFKGRIIFNEPLSMHTTFAIGGPCRIFIEPHDIADLRIVLRFIRMNKMRYYILGNGSNVLVEDKGFEGAIIHPGGEFEKIKFSKDGIQAGCAVQLSELIRRAADEGLGGMECFMGIPATVGGAVFMNAGGVCRISEFVKEIKVMDKDGKIIRLRNKKIKFDYRYSGLEKYIILEVTFCLEKKPRDVILNEINKYLYHKKMTQPIGRKSAGCIFKNPYHIHHAGKLIELCGLKGKRIGGAEVSKTHANFIVNSKNASARDVIELIRLIKRNVKHKFKIELEPEVKII